MQPQQTSWIQKLILLVLVAILGCLVVIIVQNRRHAPAEVTASSEEAAAEPTPPPADQPVESAPAPEPMPVVHPGFGRVVAGPPTAPAAPLRRSASVVTEEYRSIERSDLTVIDAQPVIPPVPAPAVEIPIRRIGAIRQAPPPRRAILAPGFGGAGSANLTGTVYVRGTPPPERQIPMGATCGALNPAGASTRHYVVSPQGGLANVVVYVKAGLENVRFAPPREPVVLDSVGCLFEPYVSVAQVGQKIRFRNLDPIMHNVHATPKNSKEFNFAQVVAGAINERTFDTPELFIRVKCDVNEWMFAYLTVLDHPFAAVTDGEGRYQLPPGLPPGTYTLAAHHLKAGEMTQKITVGHSDLKPLDFVLEIPARLSGL